jgi:type I restriction enzyme S subunit
MEKYTYKDSSIEWLGDIPEHWEITKIKKEFKVQPSNVNKKAKEDEKEVLLCNYVDVYYNNYITNDIDFMDTATASENEIKKFQIEIGDVIITKDSEDPLDIGVPALVKETQEKLLCGYHLSMLRSIRNKIDGAFLFWSLNNEFIASQLFREATGVTRWAIASRHVKNSSFAFPPLKEQKAIAEYLDKATARIDRIIAIKQEQLVKMEEMRKSAFFKACTQGLNPDIEFIEVNDGHIKKMPVHWRYQRIKRGCESIDTGKTPSSGEPEYFIDGTIEWYAPECFNDELFISEPKKLINEKALEDNQIKIYAENSVYFVAVGATAGKVGIIQKPSSCNQQINILKTNFRLLPEFLTYQLKIIEKEIIKFAQYTTLPILNQAKTGYLQIVFPPIEEQKEIVEYLNNYTEKLKKTKASINSQIKTLQVYRKNLIHECVTGKKQVTSAIKNQAYA